MEKFTKRNALNLMLTLSDVKADARLVAYCENELALLDKKNGATKKPTATQEANKVLQANIADFLSARVGERFTCTELTKTCPACAGLSTSKVSAQMSALLAEGKVSKTIEKRVSYFSAV